MSCCCKEMESCMGNEVNSFLQELRVKPLEDFRCLSTFSSGFYSRCGFTPNELQNPNKDTLRMYRTLYEKDDDLYD